MYSPPSQAMPAPESVRFVPAGFLVRLIAYILDNIFLTLICMVTGLGIGIVLDMPALAVLDAMWETLAIVTIFYYVAFWAMVGATPGKMLLGLQIVDAHGNSEGIGWLRAIARLFAFWLGTLVLYLGVIWIAIDRDKQGWHDKIAGTYVVHS